MNACRLLAALVLLSLSARAQVPLTDAPLTAAQDHQRLMDLLHLTALRPGVSHDTTAANPVNYDESKANPWPLPDPLVFADGTRVRTAQQWQTRRRPELFALFDREVLGRVPANVPGVRWEVASTTPSTEGTSPTLTRKLLGHVDNTAYPAVAVTIELAVTLPANAKGRVPIVLELTFENYPRPRTSAVEKAAAPPEAHPTWKEQVLARGWGYALLYPTTIQPDNGAGLTQGIIGLTRHGQPRQPDDWGVLRAWAWGASRALDALATDPAVDAAHVALQGHSRFGKAALVAMTYDPRFAVAFVNSSGAGGASPARRRFGEQMENLAAPGEYHWMAGNYLKYAELTPKLTTPAEMPVDMHELLALCAPRPVFLAGGTVAGGDGWADVGGSFLAAAAASPVYALLGARGVGVTTIPPVGTALISGDLGFFQHPGGHTPLPSFPTFLTFASRYMTLRLQAAR